MAGRRSIVGVLAVLGLAVCALVALWAGRTNAAINVFVSCHDPGGGPQGLINAIQAANAEGGGTISLERNCTYTLTNGPFEDGRGQVGLPIVESAITIAGNGATIARAGGSPAFRIFEVNDNPAGVLTLQRTILQGGNSGENIDSSRGGGAILVNGPGSAWISNSVFTGNKSNLAGAVMAWEATVRITDSRFRGNEATLGLDGAGGALGNRSGRLVVTNSVITGGTVDLSGGGIGSSAGATKVTNTTISGNRTVAPEGTGGGIAVTGFNGEPATLTVDRSTLSANRVPGFEATGGAIAGGDGSTLAVTDSTISGNSAGETDSTGARGGAIYSNADDVSVTTSTIANNRVIGDDARGGGLFSSGFQPLTVTASIVALNPGRNCAGRVLDGGFNLENGGTCSFTDHAVNADPRLDRLADNGGYTATQALLGSSPAIDQVPKGRPYCGGTVDQRGVKRPQGPACDIGSFELKLVGRSR